MPGREGFGSSEGGCGLITGGKLVGSVGKEGEGAGGWIGGMGPRRGEMRLSSRMLVGECQFCSVGRFLTLGPPNVFML